MIMESLLIGTIATMVIIFLIYLGFLIWTLVDIVKKDGGAKWVTLSILGLILPFLLSILGLIYGIVIMIVWWAASRNKLRTKSKKEKKNLNWLWILLIILAILITIIVVAAVMSGNQASIAASQKYPFWYR